MTTLVVTDLDGTFWDTSTQCHPDTLAAANTLLERSDVVLLVATGRRQTSAGAALAANGLTIPGVLLNGAVGFDYANDTLFHQRVFSQAQLADVLARLQARGLAPVCYQADGTALAIEGVSTSAKHLQALGDELQWTTADQVAQRHDVLGMSMLGIDRSLLEPAHHELATVDGVHAASYADHLYPPYSLMLAPAGVTKAVGIRAFLDYANLSPERIVALGDGGNDLEMLEMADVALAVSDADHRALALAHHLIDVPQQGGWASVLDYC